MARTPTRSTTSQYLAKLASGDEFARQEAADWLEKLPIGYFENHAIPRKQLRAISEQLGLALRNTESRLVRRWCAQILANLGQDAVGHLPALIELLQETRIDVLTSAIWAVGSMRHHAKVAVPELLKHIRNGDREIRWRIHWALGEIKLRGGEIERALASSFEDHDHLVRGYAVFAFVEIAERTDWARQQLTRMVDDPEQMPRGHARQALANWTAK